MDEITQSSIYLRDPYDFGYKEYPVANKLLWDIKYSLAVLIYDFAKGLDLNHWRAGLSIRDAKRQEMRFIIGKASEGIWEDPSFKGYQEETHSVNLPFGAFCYWRAIVEAIKQAKFFFDVVGNDIELLPILDVEKYNNQGILSVKDAAEHILATLREIQQLFGRKAMIYTNRDSWQVLTANAPFIADFPLWVASWTNALQPTLPIGAEEWTLWQFTNSYVIDGAPHAGYDGSRFNGNEGKFEEYVRSINGEPSPDCCEELREKYEQLLTKINAFEIEVLSIQGALKALEGDQKETQKQVNELLAFMQYIKDYFNPSN